MYVDLDRDFFTTTLDIACFARRAPKDVLNHIWYFVHRPFPGERYGKSEEPMMLIEAMPALEEFAIFKSSSFLEPEEWGKEEIELLKKQKTLEKFPKIKLLPQAETPEKIQNALSIKNFRSTN